MGGQGPPYPVRFQSFMPSRTPAGRFFAVAPLGSAVTEAGMLYTTQCTQVVFGALGSGASGSSTMSAKLFVPAGAPLHSRGAEVSLPSQVYSLGISPLCENAGEVSESVMGASWDPTRPPGAADAAIIPNATAAAQPRLAGLTNRRCASALARNPASHRSRCRPLCLWRR